MITGDHAVTAQAIAKQIGIADADTVPAISGRELAEISDADLPEIADRTAVFARVAPEQKLRLVRALQSRGHILAMTGDGVNDGPALKQADIGIAMGITGTDVAKGAASMVLTDDNFATIAAAVEEGRGVYDNLIKFLVWTLPVSVGFALILLTSVVFGLTLPTLPVHLLWVNLTTAILLGLMLVFEPPEADIMKRPPRDQKTPIFDFAMFMRTGLVSMIMLAGSYWVFFYEQNAGSTIAVCRTAVVNTVVAVASAYLINCRSLRRSIFSIGWFSNPRLWIGIGLTGVLQLIFTYAPVMNRYLHTAPLDATVWLRILGVAVGVALGAVSGAHGLDGAVLPRAAGRFAGDDGQAGSAGSKGDHAGSRDAVEDGVSDAGGDAEGCGLCDGAFWEVASRAGAVFAATAGV
jgi:magnesium-transporting ATPase (P-type)